MRFRRDRYFKATLHSIPLAPRIRFDDFPVAGTFRVLLSRAGRPGVRSSAAMDVLGLRAG
jgi:hypothetical protein